MTSPTIACTVDPFASLKQQEHNVSNLIWASSTRGSLKQEPPFHLYQDHNGIIRIQDIIDRLQKKTGIQVGYQLLQLQGKDVDDYQGGFEELQRTIEESLATELVVVKPQSDTDLSSPACINDSMITATPTEDLEPNIETPPKKRQSKRRSGIYDPGDGWVKISPIPKEEKKDPFASLQNRYRHDDLLWASSKRYYTRHPVPIQLIKDEDNAIRIQQVDPDFQEATGVQVGQRLVQLQERDIGSYHDLEEIQRVVQETLEITFVVIRSKAQGSLSSTNGSKMEKHKPRSSVSKVPLNDDDHSHCAPKSETSIMTEASSTDLELHPTSETSLEAIADPKPQEKPTMQPRRSWFKSKLFRSGRKTRVSIV